MNLYITDGTQWSVRDIENIDEVFEVLSIMKELCLLKNDAELYYISEDSLEEWEEIFPPVYKEIKEEEKTCLI